MKFPHLQQQWLPYFVAAFGILCSILLWYIHFLWLDHPPITIKDFFAWLALLLGVGISILIGALIKVIQSTHQRTIIFNQMNEKLKKEIGERISAEETKQKLEVALLQGQKLQAMGTLAGGIAHDFNNILYAIIGYVEMARDDVDKESLIYKNLGKVLEATHRGQELVSRILAFSRRHHHQVEPIPLKSSIEAALALLRPTIPAGVIIQFEGAADCQILGNQTQIHQVLVNLINNAVDAMDSEGIITIQLSQIAANDRILKQFPEARAQNYCRMEITDTGHGMDQNLMDRIFEPFFTTKEVGKGTGLGLSIVHTIIKEHQGEITVTSQLGHGTTFMILLPEYTS
jgi:two-component system, cell cycle sensor histidine kinase and response regulator CckA